MTRRNLLVATLAAVAAGGAVVPMLHAAIDPVSLGVVAESREHPPAFGDHPAASPFRGPPWISIEYPPSPYDRVTREAFLLVHAYHHSTPADFPVSGKAEGMVDGKRRTVELQFQRTSRPGVFALRRQWPEGGRWVLSLNVHQGDFVAGALVKIGADGRVAGVDVPTRRMGSDDNIPRAISAAEIEAALRGD